MRENKNKEAFINEQKKRIELRNELLNFFITYYLPLLQQFNGKVYNIRFIKALREKAKELPNLGDLIHISERDNYYPRIEMQIYLGRFTYTQYELIYLPCELTKEGGIDYEKSSVSEYATSWIENFKYYTEQIQNVIDHYDEYMAVTEETQKAIDEWNKLPIVFRCNFDKSTIWV